MTRNDTFLKGDIAATKCMLDLQQKGYGVFLPLGEQYPFDVVAMNLETKEFIRIQCKNLGGSDNRRDIKDGTWHPVTKKRKKYDKDAFDYYALFIPEKDIVIYPSIKFKGETVVVNLSTSIKKDFYWYEDFLEFTDIATKKSLSDFGMEYVCHNKGKKLGAFPHRHKVKHPTKKQLEKMVWEKPTSKLSEELGVSDKAIGKWCKSMGIKKPPRGYWSKKRKKRL